MSTREVRREHQADQRAGEAPSHVSQVVDAGASPRAEYEVDEQGLPHAREERVRVGPETALISQCKRCHGTHQAEDRTGSADGDGARAAVVEAEQVAADAREQVDEQQPLLAEGPLSEWAEAPQRVRVGEQVHQRSVKEHRRKQPVPLALKNEPIDPRTRVHRGLACGLLRSVGGKSQEKNESRERQRGQDVIVELHAPLQQLAQVTRSTHRVPHGPRLCDDDAWTDEAGKLLREIRPVAGTITIVAG